MKRKSSKYGFNFVEENMRDPNSMRILEGASRVFKA